MREPLNDLDADDGRVCRQPVQDVLLIGRFLLCVSFRGVGDNAKVPVVGCHALSY